MSSMLLHMLTRRYAARSVSVQPEATDSATFQVYYVNNGALNSKFWSAWQVRVANAGLFLLGA